MFGTSEDRITPYKIQIFGTECDVPVVKLNAWFRQQFQPIVENFLKVETYAGKILLGDRHDNELESVVAFIAQPVYLYDVPRGADEQRTLDHFVRPKVDLHVQLS